MKELFWVGESKATLKKFPREVQRVMGRALDEAQRGGKATNAKPLKGYIGAGILEIVDDYDGDTYRAVYTVRFADRAYVLHVFQKKSKRGVATPRRELGLIRQRLAAAEADAASRQREGR